MEKKVRVTVGNLTTTHKELTDEQVAYAQGRNSEEKREEHNLVKVS